MRKLFAILLLVTLVVALYGYHLFFQVQIGRAKNEMKEFLRSQKTHKDLVVFRFTKTELLSLKWEDEHEFRYGGRMYDVVDQLMENGSVVIHCIQDEKETALLNNFLKTTKNSGQNTVVQLLITPFVLPGIDIPQAAERQLSLKFQHLSFYFNNPDLSIVIPPPERV